MYDMLGEKYEEKLLKTVTTFVLTKEGNNLELNGGFTKQLEEIECYSINGDLFTVNRQISRLYGLAYQSSDELSQSWAEQSCNNTISDLGITWPMT